MNNLEKVWAAFFELAGFAWVYKPLNQRYDSDFLVWIPCGHSECQNHELIVKIEPYTELSQAKAFVEALDDMYHEPNPACFGVNPEVTYWQMSHGSGGGEEEIGRWVHGDAMKLWDRAVQLASTRN